MITLNSLRQLAEQLFPHEHPRLVHLLHAWAVRDPEGELTGLLHGTGLDAGGMAAALTPLLPVPAEEDAALLKACILGAPDGLVLGWHLLRALCHSPRHRVSVALATAGLDTARLHEHLAGLARSSEGVLARYGIAVDASASPLLEYGRELTALAAEGTFDDLCDRPEEIARLTQVLLRKNKANPVLTGAAGVGKTALLELLARQVARNEVSGFVAGTRIFELRLGKLVAGTKYRGDFEQRLEKVIEAFLASQPAILFIDEVHLLWGTGRAEGAPLDAGNLLKPLLARGSARIIGATTVQEYQQYIVRDEALARRFQELRLAEPDPALTAKMVRKQADGLAQHHGIEISAAVIAQAIELTDRHVPNRVQPDKSVDLLDTASASARSENRRALSVGDLLTTLARQTGRPIAALTGEDRITLRNLSQSLQQRVIGQNHAVERVVATLVQHRQDLGAPQRNLGTFLFAGDSGVGKSELARALAASFFGSEKALLTLDMAEYNEPGSVNKLIGSPPGFAGSERDGTLITWLHLHGSGVILFDEIEKSHPDVWRLLLGLLDNGRITSARGQALDTRQCVVILTTNALTARALDRGGLGFSRTKDTADPVDLLADTFPREFLGRLDEVILFHRLGPREVCKILKLRLDEALARLRRKRIHVTFDEQRLLEHLLAGLTELKTGARGIGRLLEQKLLQPIALAALSTEGDGEIAVSIGEDFYRDGAAQAVSAPRLPVQLQEAAPKQKKRSGRSKT